MQVIIILFLLLGTNGARYVSILWFIVEFVLLLVRGGGFDWMSVISIIFFYTLHFILTVLLALYHKEEKTTKKSYSGKFQERLEAMQKQKNK